jgi:hypothetical protein
MASVPHKACRNPSGVEAFCMVRSTLLLLLTLPFCSCMHTSSAPVANHSGVPVIIKVVGTKPGSQPRMSECQRIAEDLLAGNDQKNLEKKYFSHPDSPPVRGAAMVLGQPGTFTLRNGKKTVGYFPMVVIRANRPAAECDQAVTQLAKQCYANAAKSYVLIPVTELKKQTKP